MGWESVWGEGGAGCGGGGGEGSVGGMRRECVWGGEGGAGCVGGEGKGLCFGVERRGGRVGEGGEWGREEYSVLEGGGDSSRRDRVFV